MDVLKWMCWKYWKSSTTTPKSRARSEVLRHCQKLVVSRKVRLENLSRERIPLSLHFPVRYEFQRRKTIAYGVNKLGQSDCGIGLKKNCHGLTMTIDIV
ncbi:hypothetical protein CEXT_189071 [Caerostris extrusa]|uniref:Uncharacterized protein n=1 Tax=Caerostris extrusa TaxID=172846 RepID=A0AAV4X2W3_CAEEX|nr:hypothetical protein CEXT_189071 [Caerostris extrusa]